jgi:uncharacterized membrane protein YphA (DoxX/SURF4 family)
MNLRKMIYHVSRLIMACVFIYSGVIKATDVVGFAGQIALYQLFPYSWNFLVAAILPYLELLCGLLLLSGRRVKPATLILIGLNLVFIVVLGTAIARGFDIDCGCFKPGAENPTTPIAALLRDLALMLLLLLTWFLHTDLGGRQR